MLYLMPTHVRRQKTKEYTKDKYYAPKISCVFKGLDALPVQLR